MKQVKSLIAEVAIIRPDRDNYSLFTTDEIWELEPKEDNYDHCGFLQIGDEITVENKRYKIKRLSFRINPKPSDIREGVDIYSQEPQYLRNCTVLVFVE